MADEGETLPDTAILLDGQLVDVAPLLPLKMGSWKALRKLGVDPISIGQKINRGTGEMDGGILSTLVYWVLAKLDPERFTEAYLDDRLEMPQMIKLGGAIMQQEARKTAEGPTSTSSSPLPNVGTGDQATSIN
jgi:hypothetical protein